MDTIVITTIFFMFIIFYIMYNVKKKYYRSFFVAFVMSLSWTIYYGYNYKGTNLYLFGSINLFALLGWTAGLMVLFTAFCKLHEKLKNKWKALGVTYALYLILIFPFEWFGYNILKIQLTSSFHGIFNLPLMHGSPLLKVYYLTAGAIYLLILIAIGEIKDEKKKKR